ncbi:MAG: hypothetical protein UFP41_04540 [Bacilli bacterium]|nr:hypothetical protein [Bacilli bacterium]
METKIPMKTIYLILVITIGLVGLGVGSTFAVFTASAEISNPISFSSNLSYDGEVFDTVEVTIGPNLSRDVNFAIFNTAMLPNINYVIWYIYEGNSSDLNFTTDDGSSPSGVVSYREGDPQQGEELYFNVINNTSNTITITMGVATSQSDIVLPSYMKPVTISAPSTHKLTLIKGTGVGNIYYKVNGASSYTAMSKNLFKVSLDVTYGTTYYYYGTVSSRGYTLNSCTSSNPCSGTMGASDVTKTLSATPKKYSITLEKGTGVDKIYYKIGSAGSYTNTTNSSVTFSADFNETIYYYGTPLTGYTMGDGKVACTASSPCSYKVALINSAKTISATANNYNLTLNKGTGVSTIYYKINGASSYTSSSSNKTLSVKYGTTYYYYGTASTGYTMNSCTSSSPCSGTMGASAVTKTLSASVNSYTLNLNKGTGVSRIYYKINGASRYTSSTSNKSLRVQYNTTYYYYGVASSGYTMSSCTSSNPCSGTMGTSTVTKTLSATATSSGPFTVIITVLGSEETRGTTSNGTFTATGVYTMGLTSISCTNGATATVSGETVTVTNITADTTCNIS